jgi:hypothetical protein
METIASSGRTKRLYRRKSIATIDAIEHVLNVANSYLDYRHGLDPNIADDPGLVHVVVRSSHNVFLTVREQCVVHE